MKVGTLTIPMALLLAFFAPAITAAQVPAFAVESICKGTIDNPKTHEACLRDEQSARDTLNTRWSQFAASDRSYCVSETSSDNTPSYVELLVCLQIAAEVKKLPKKDVDFAPHPAPAKK
jgi:hypothetical protein